MTKKLFTEKEIQTLSRNSYVKSVSEKGMTYTDEFKRISIGPVGNATARSIKSAENTLEVFEHQELSIKQAKNYK